MIYNGRGWATILCEALLLCGPYLPGRGWIEHVTDLTGAKRSESLDRLRSLDIRQSGMERGALPALKKAWSC